LVLRVKTVKTDHTVFPSEALSAGSAGGASFLPGGLKSLLKSFLFEKMGPRVFFENPLKLSICGGRASCCHCEAGGSSGLSQVFFAHFFLKKVGFKKPLKPFLFLKKRNRENTSSWDAASKFRVSTPD